MIGAQRERVKCSPSSHAKADETVARGALAKKTTQEPHNEKELINPDEPAACGAAVQAENITVPRVVSIHSENEPSVLRLPPCKMQRFFLVRGVEHGPFSQRHTDARNVHDVTHARGSIRSPSAQNMVQESLNRKEPYRFTNPDEAVSFGVQ